MKVGSPTFVGCKWSVVILTIIAGGLIFPAYCRASDIELLVQQTPTKAGVITPIAGVYRFAPNSEITLTASPKSGYEFSFWLGDVSDPTASNTVVYLDKPKIVIAVFEKAEYGNLEGLENVPGGGGGGGGGGGLVPTATYFGNPGGLSAGGGGSKGQTVIYSINSDATKVPEPATGALLVLGSLFAFARRGAKKRTRKNRNLYSSDRIYRQAK